MQMEKFRSDLFEWVVALAALAVLALALYALTYVDDVYGGLREAWGDRTPSVQYQNDLNSNYDPPDCGGRSCGR
jgi:hypothetical protein